MMMNKFSESTNCLNCKKSSKCFKKLIPSELEFISQNKTQIQFRAGETICKQGAFASYVLYITDGLVKIYLESRGNRSINVNISKSYEFIALSTIFGENIHNYSAQALCDSSICLIEKESFKKLLLGNGIFASEIVKWYCDKEKQLFEKIKSIGHKQMHGRLADVLLYLNRVNIDQDNIFIHLTRKDFADFACISMESIVRLLTELKNANIIEIKGKDIKILQMDQLKEISKRG
jgi:CRP/FNR family transcriptional regulator